MLSDNIKQAIRTAYKAFGENLENFNPRKQQTFLIAEIAKTLAGEYSKDRKLIAIEAGTGTGKSLAYSLGAIPLAKAKDKKVCISTATVALQEQLVEKDLPFLKQHSGIDFSFTLVKGRQRYVCRQKLTAAVSVQDSPQPGFTFAEKPSERDLTLLKQLHSALKENRWQGDRDSWADPIPHHIWQLIQSDKYSCLRNVADHTHCPFHKARETMDNSDVLVINHSLLLADLEMGGGKILPDPEDTFYIIDEAHHLPKITRDHASAAIAIKGATEWLDKLKELADKMAKLIKSQSAISPSLKLADDCTDLLTDLQKVLTFIDANKSIYFAPNKRTKFSTDKDSTVYRFEHGVLPKAIKQPAEDLEELSKKCLNHANKLYFLLMEAVKDGEVASYLAEPLLSEYGFLNQRLENFHALWAMYAKVDSEKAAPVARWCELTEHKKLDYLLAASPIEVGFTLEDKLWSKCEGAVLCSATIMALNSFDHFRRQVGLSNTDGTQYQKVDSPFNYQQCAQLNIIDTEYEPSDERFSDELIRRLPKLIAQGEATLVLFSSYWQMETVAKALREKNTLSILVQGEQSRQHIIESHKKHCDNNENSIVFGTQSFSEGLDLPGKYLTNLIITKLPFSVPTSPVEEAHAEYVSAKGGNPFMSISVPEASKKLIQATGRLLRNEKDTGIITILDKRLKTKRYGQDLLNALPPYKRG
ncbi:ATP-dependent DNA helicase DinG [Thalassotalea sp. 1_MG-2023]|uniref:ATP-dependent DNA helicase DinG n=1 Tax=Thalassotalea sp. 1_MG-2023 TaxID=3062680 RepID=UPI0026E2FFFF|nr:ATP-dependent DNA helicase DinG [Thalassotalea sp. 1_MG-2023]MDO6427800.1 ATP-dependent DNA helicase DinG [Thalassotalea sp. 1_MG-2023]